MAARSRNQAPVGSAKWVYDERQQTDQFVDQEVEDFTYLARNEMEWLNEHMAEIFSKTQFDVAEVFKTPGKLRGKTPRTAKKGNASATRAPLTDVFAPNSQQLSPTRNAQPLKQKLTFEVAEDKENAQLETIKETRHSYGAGKENTDSGYHGLTEDEMDVDRNVNVSVLTSPQRIPQPVMNSTTAGSRLQALKDEEARPQRESTGSFVSAKEAPSKSASVDRITEAPTQDQPSQEAEILVPISEAQDQEEVVSGTDHYHISAEAENEFDAVLRTEAQESPSHQLEAEQSPSDTSSPERPTIRKKSSLTFASLPAREPLATKKSVGARNSRTSHLDQSKNIAAARDSQFSRLTTGKSLTGGQQPSVPDEDDDLQDIDTGNLETENDDTQTLKTTSETKLHNKNSTQSLHDRIAMLGKSNASQLSKPKSFGLAASQNLALVSQGVQLQDSTTEQEDNDDDWIQPIKAGIMTEGSNAPESLSERALPFDKGLLKAQDHEIEVKNTYPSSEMLPEEIPSEAKVAQAPTTEKATTGVFKSGNTSYPDLTSMAAESTTPAGSPMLHKHGEGPLSASKARLYSVFKTAKGIFASSAGVSAQAKMETLSPQSSRLRTETHHPSLAEVFSQNPRSTSSYPQLNKTETFSASDAIVRDANQINTTQPKRRSSQRLQETKERTEVAQPESAQSILTSQIQSEVPEEMKTGSTERHQNPKAVEKRTIQMVSVNDDAADMPPPPPPKSSSRLQNPGEAKRPPKPSKEPATKAKPAPVSIRVPSLAAQKAGHTQPGGSFSSSSQDTAAPVPPPKAPTLTKKGSNSSLKSTTSSARPKALEAAARKKEQDEREAQRKAEQKRELERRRAAKQEEEKRAQEQKAAEQQRANEAKIAAQKQAAEQRKADLARKAELQRSQAAAAPPRLVEDTTRPERQPYGPSNPVKADLGASRPVSRDMSRPAVPHVNPAKPPLKRQPQTDDDDQFQFSRVQKSGVATSNNSAKRRRTSEELSPEQHQQRPTMAPPIRRSNMTKEAQNKFTHGFMHASASHGGPSMHKTALSNQQSMQHPKTPHMNDLATYHQGRIPFAEAPNPPQGSQIPQSQQFNRSQGPHNSKTPGSSKTPKHASSPQYPNGDNIELPEIATDSEDSDDERDNDFVAPDWADSPALRELLRQQQLVDPLKVFGPIAPLVMEDVFKGNKERHAKFRNRTSSANWNGPDRLTEEERRRDWEAREKFEKEGGWTYGAGFNPTR